ncbi:MAG: HAD-IIIC family phosphatase [Clostridium sp.]|uniref:HAD family hydrolase n=1 Tax=Clostridium sp. TaxID=1506 RepID=UPI003D6D0699
MHTYKTIIFDLDGTLFKTDTVFIDAIYQVCISSEEEIQFIRKELRTIEDKLINVSAQLYEDVKNMLDNLKKEGYILCICTNGSNHYVNNILKTFGISNYFTIIKSRREGLTKGQLIKQILDESACCSAIVVGDTAIDFKSADDTSCLSIGVSYGYGGNAYKNVDFIADKPVDIYNIIKKINGFYQDIAMQILDRKQKNMPLVVGINGVDTSGKTTFTKEFDRYLSN